MAKPRKELSFQGHIIDSYELAGGYAKKWATEMSVGNPDLVCALSVMGGHLVEVKHRPEWRFGALYSNPLTPMQKKFARDYMRAGGKVFGAVVFGSSRAIGSFIFYFDPTQDDITISQAYPYKLGAKFPIGQILEDLKHEDR